MGLFNRRKPDPKPEPKPIPPDASVTQAMLIAHNNKRAQASVQPLTLNDKLIQAAQKHAAWMAANRTMSHTGEKRSSVSDRITQAGYSFKSAGENIAMGSSTVEQTMTMWMNSSGHRNNILNSQYREAGFGMSNKYWCAVFGNPRVPGVISDLPSIDEGIIIESGPIEYDPGLEPA